MLLLAPGNVDLRGLPEELCVGGAPVLSLERVLLEKHAQSLPLLTQFGLGLLGASLIKGRRCLTQGCGIAALGALSL